MYFSCLMLPNNSVSFITNNVKGMQLSKMRLKLMQYFKDKIGSNGILFLQETGSDSKVDQKWKADFKGPIYFLTESKFLWRLNCLFWSRNVYR